MEYLISAFTLILFFNSPLPQESRLYDNGYKKFIWGSTAEVVGAYIGTDFHLDKGFSYNFEITETDKENKIVYTKREDNVYYSYEFVFFNNLLYKIILKVGTSEDQSYPLLREIEQSFFKDIEKSYGRPKITNNTDIINKVTHSSSWYSSKIDIMLYYDEAKSEFLGGYTTDGIVFKLYLTDKNKSKEIEWITKKYQDEKKKKEDESAKKKANTIREKF